ncbi:MAG: CoA pyrophosphatase [Gemmatimonadetes bacterium]|jgi:8-oxo-dGTP pyrophosphatase MutT (NUDIX family)|nr:CoA pyrophosphatase [Gemmatimonadota bacterium]MBT6144801.1 CoA pyrophosphatase [Gemmatimonadota bacterium]MBT7864150.1 CoA pyrophosphatase [Gemmatimonadota bacterium]
MPRFPIPREALADYEPRLVTGDGDTSAAVAAIFHDVPDDPRLLFIERARRDGDPWSGDLAFPGGRAEPGDADVHDTAERETLEEIGWSLAGASRLGRLDDMAANVLPMTVSACVYAIDALQPPHLSSEVVDLFWVPVADLCAPERRTTHIRRRHDEEQQFHALNLLGTGRPLLWGVTYRFVSDLMRFFGHELPN